MPNELIDAIRNSPKVNDFIRFTRYRPGEEKVYEKTKNDGVIEEGNHALFSALATSRKINKKLLKVAGAEPIPEGTVVDAVGKCPNL
ncbi:hypothetical protein [Serratia odorifera]|uniref:Uncharacterized protein n=1 Tax=Serratia odorifera DSM 4582 TaxID=667129 RepID=D4E4Y1_SEROD|nr:hypothetical protein [Serratia odorifera]EFE95177.1 hypothetical protein HMPREF0758_3231 [Serratia odorifera DSM 4582]